MNEDILRGVSRSFYLSLRLLPPSVRPAISLAYALARASDTVADSSALPPSERLQILAAMPGGIPSLSVDDPSEARLLASFDELLADWRASSDRDLIEAVWTQIREGQAMDLSTFPRATPLTPEELESYCQLVAGCVGEFWTDVCFRHVKDYSGSHPAELRGTGASFGRALQRVNILRDRPADAARGRIYIPADRVAAEIETARQGLGDGLAYARAIRPRRLRTAVALPARLGLETLALIEKNPSTPRIKVPRSTVWRCLLQAFLG